MQELLHTSPVRSVVFSSDRRRLASGWSDSSAWIWDAETGAACATLEGHTSSVRSVALSPDGRRLAPGSGDSTARIWDAKMGVPRVTLEGHTCLVSSDDSTVQIWVSETGPARRVLEVGSSLSFSSDGCNLIAEIGQIALDHTSLLPIRTPNWSGCCLYNNSWIAWNGKNVLWLPQNIDL